jgi:hypothetical protein
MKAKHLKLWQDAPNYLGTNYEGYYVVYSQSDASEISDMANYRVLSRFINNEDCIEASFGGFFGRFTSILLKKDSPLVKEIDNLIEKTKTVYYLLDEQVYGEIQNEKWMEYWNETGCKECAKEILKVFPELEDKIAYKYRQYSSNMGFYDEIDLLVSPEDLLKVINPFLDYLNDETVSICQVYEGFHGSFGFEDLSTPQRSELRDALILIVNPNWEDGIQLELTLS